MALGDAAQPQAVRSNRVVLDAYRFIKGWLIATPLWVGVLLLVVACTLAYPPCGMGLTPATCGAYWAWRFYMASELP